MSLGIKDQILKNLAVIREELEEARENLKLAQAKTDRLEREEKALQSAIDIMDGKTSESQTSIGSAVSSWTSIPTPPSGAKYAKFNGETVLLEPGWRVGKNSFGEDVLLPADAPNPEPMQEPIRPAAPPQILPPLGSDEGFSADLPTPIDQMEID